MISRINKRVISSLLFASLITITSLSQAQTQLEEIVVVSSRIEQKHQSIGQSVSILSQEQIENIGQYSVPDLLRQVPGVSVSINGGPGSVSSVRLRGEEGFRTLTLIDGLRISDPSNTQVSAQLEHLMSGGLDRVEVLKGPHGLAYGADAGGVINIQTLNPLNKNKVEVIAETGAMNTRLSQFNAQLRQQAIYGAVHGSSFSSDGINQQASDNVTQDLDGYDNQTLHGTLAYEAKSGISMQWTGRSVEGESEYDGCFSISTTNQCLAEYEMFAQRLELAWKGESQSHSIAYLRTDTDRNFFADSSLSFNARGEAERFEYIANIQTRGNWQWILGGDLETLEDLAYQRDNKGVFLEGVLQTQEHLNLSVAMRHDDNDDFGQHESYRLSAAYLVERDKGSIKYHASIGTGFRAPSLYEVSYNQGPFSYPPASSVALIEEYSKGYDLGVQWYGDRLNWQLTGFYQNIENAIEFDLSAFSGYLQTTGQAHSTGLESTLEFQLSELLSIQTNYTFNSAKSPDDSARLRRPRHVLNMGLNYSSQASGWNFNLWYRTVRESIDERFGVRTKLDDYSVLDLNARYQLNKRLAFTFRLNNVTDESWQEVLGYHSIERAAFAGFKLTFAQ